LKATTVPCVRSPPPPRFGAPFGDRTRSAKSYVRSDCHRSDAGEGAHPAGMDGCVSGIGDASVTIRQEGNQGPSKETVPVLLIVGDARRGGALDRARGLVVPPTMEIGRARDESGDAEGSRVGLPDKLLSRAHLRLE